MNPEAGGALVFSLFQSGLFHLPGPMRTAARIKAGPFRRDPRLPIAIRPTDTDVKIAHTIARNTRPDRKMVLGHVHGISFSGKREDAFPSGALHMGALASAAGALPAGPRRAIRALAVGLSLTHVMVLAHWASDVAAGFALGAIFERMLRLWTGYPLRRPGMGRGSPSNLRENAK